MVHNLEKNVKGCFKRRVSVTLAVLTIFAITGSIGFAADLKTNYEKTDFGPLPTVAGPTRGAVAKAFNETNVQVNSNTVTIDVHSDELLKHGKALKELENKDKELENTIETEIAARIKEGLEQNEKIGINSEAISTEAALRKEADEELKKADEALQAAIDKEVLERKVADADLNARILRNADDIQKNAEAIKENEEKIKREAEARHQVDQMLGERITEEEKARKEADANLQANLDAEIERSKAEDKKHDKGIADNKKAIEDEVARSTAEDKKHDKGIADNKKAIEDEVARSTAEDKKHDKGIADNKKAIEDEVARSTAEDKKHDEGIAGNKKAIEDEVARSTAEDKKHDKGIADNKKSIEELRRDSEAGIASVAAMSVLDFKGAPVGRLGIGAAIGGYRSKQAVAVGMAFAPNENLNFTGKVGLSTDDIRNSAYGVGVNYFF